MIQAQAIAKNVRQSPQKIRRVARRVSKMLVKDALIVLGHTNKKAARPLYKAIKSAAANAENSNGANPDKLTIQEIQVGRSIIRRYPEFRARGRLNWRRKAYSNIKVVVGQEEPESQPKR